MIFFSHIHILFILILSSKNICAKKVPKNKMSSIPCIWPHGWLVSVVLNDNPKWILNKEPNNVHTIYAKQKKSTTKKEWPLNRIEITENGNYICLPWKYLKSVHKSVVNVYRTHQTCLFILCSFVSLYFCKKFFFICFGKWYAMCLSNGWNGFRIIFIDIHKW